MNYQLKYQNSEYFNWMKILMNPSDIIYNIFISSFEEKLCLIKALTNGIVDLKKT